MCRNNTVTKLYDSFQWELLTKRFPCWFSTEFAIIEENAVSLVVTSHGKEWQSWGDPGPSLGLEVSLCNESLFVSRHRGPADPRLAKATRPSDCPRTSELEVLYNRLNTCIFYLFSLFFLFVLGEGDGNLPENSWDGGAQGLQSINTT